MRENSDRGRPVGVVANAATPGRERTGNSDAVRWLSRAASRTARLSGDDLGKSSYRSGKVGDAIRERLGQGDDAPAASGRLKERRIGFAGRARVVWDAFLRNPVTEVSHVGSGVVRKEDAHSRPSIGSGESVATSATRSFRSDESGKSQAAANGMRLPRLGGIGHPSSGNPWPRRAASEWALWLDRIPFPGSRNPDTGRAAERKPARSL